MIMQGHQYVFAIRKKTKQKQKIYINEDNVKLLLRVISSSGLKAETVHLAIMSARKLPF